jgi:DNA-binding transcriptional MerR regulator
MTIREVTARCGATVGQVHYMHDRGIVHPRRRHRPTKRDPGKYEYSPVDVLRACIAMDIWRARSVDRRFPTLEEIDAVVVAIWRSTRLTNDSVDRTAPVS